MFALLPWSISFLSVIGLIWAIDLDEGPGEKVEPPWSREEALILLAAFVVGLAFRAFDLGEIPYRIQNDEMQLGIGARLFRGTSPPAPFHVMSWFNITALQVFVSSLLMRVFGDGLVGLRSVHVLFGMVSLAGGYRFVRLLFGRRVATWTLLLALPFHWHVHYSRSGLHYIQTAAIMTWTLYFLALGLMTKRRLPSALAGLGLGLGLQFYWANRLLVPLMALWLLYWAIRRGEARSALRSAGCVLATAIPVLLPLTLFYFAHPDTMFGRETAVSIFNPQHSGHMISVVGTGSAPQVLAHQAKVSFGLFCCNGANEEQYPFPWPFLPAWILPLFLGGLLLGTFHLLQPRWFFFLSWYVATMISVLLAIDAPGSQHAVGFSATVLLPIAFAFEWLRRKLGGYRWLDGLFTVMLGAWSCWNFTIYFKEYAKALPGTRADSVGRLVWKHRDVVGIVDLDPDRPENFDSVLFRFLAPGVPGRNVTPKEIAPSALERLISSQKRPVFLYGAADGFPEKFIRDRFHPAEMGIIPGSERRDGLFWAVIR